jgi:hypothetical protein
MTMPSVAGAGLGDAIAFGVAADLTYTIYSATNSSPQTTELFAKDRSATLWKYVRLGTAQAVVLIGTMAWRAWAGGGGLARAFWPAAGGVSVGVMMYMMYAHALQAGGGQKPAQGAR